MKTQQLKNAENMLFKFFGLICLFIISIAAASASLTDSLYAKYKFNSSAPLNDSIGTNEPLINTSPPVDFSSAAIVENGVYQSTGYGFSTLYYNATNWQPQTFSVNAWVKPDSLYDISQCIIDHTGYVDSIYYGFSFTLRGNGSLLAYIGTGDGNFNLYYGGSTAFEDVWIMATLVIDSDNDYLSIYINGTMVYNNSFTQEILYNYTDGIGIGNGNVQANVVSGFMGNPFDGLLDEVALWDRALSPSEIQDIFDIEKTGVGFESVCIPEWVCSNFGSCLANSTRVCDAVYDLNICSVEYTGDFSEFSSGVCSNMTDNTLFYEDFEPYAEDVKLSRWVDETQPPSPGISDFTRTYFNGTHTFLRGNSSGASPVKYSLYNSSEAISASNYTITSKLRITEDLGNRGAGIAFYSELLGDNLYYIASVADAGQFRLLFEGDTFLDPGLGNCTDSLSGVTPAVGSWYNIKAEITSLEASAKINAKVWEDGDSEPGNWQISCLDDVSGWYTSGTFGFYVRDSVSDFEFISVEETNLDITPPEIDLIYPEPANSSVFGYTVNIIFQAYDENLDRVNFTVINSSSDIVYSEAYTGIAGEWLNISKLLSTSNMSSGTYDFIIEASDSVNTYAEYAVFQVDKETVPGSFISPNGTVAGEAVLVSWNGCSPVSGSFIAEYNISLDNGTFNSAVYSGSGTSFFMNSSLYPDEMYNFLGICTDNYSNSAYFNSSYFEIHNIIFINPVLSTNITNNTVYGSHLNSFSYSCSADAPVYFQLNITANGAISSYNVSANSTYTSDSFLPLPINTLSVICFYNSTEYSRNDYILYYSASEGAGTSGVDYSYLIIPALLISFCMSIAVLGYVFGINILILISGIGFVLLGLTFFPSFYMKFLTVIVGVVFIIEWGLYKSTGDIY